MAKQQKHESLVSFTYERSREHRVIHATGARGAITPGGELLFELFSEALIPPDVEVHEIKEDGSLGRVVQVGAKLDVVPIQRLVEVSVAVSIADAERIATWLLQKVEEGKSRQELLSKSRKDAKNG